MKLSKMEKRIVAAMTKKKSRVWSIEELAEIAYEEKVWPTYWNSSISAIMRGIMIKTMHSDKRIVRTSSLGRGNTATYTVETAEEEKPKRAIGGRAGAAAR